MTSMKKTTVYMLTIGNGMHYIGVATNLRRRVNEHKARDALVGRMIRAHGLESVTVLHEGLDFYEAMKVEVAEIAERETQWPSGLNIAQGGQGCSGFPAAQHVIEQRRAMMYKRNAETSAADRERNWKKGIAMSAATPWSDERRAKHAERMRQQHAARKEAGMPSATAKAVEAARASWTPERRERQKAAMKKALQGGWSPARRAAYEAKKLAPPPSNN